MPRKTPSRILFCRIGWMTRYAGPQPEDPKPIGGGSYNREEVGHEAFNFRELPGSDVQGYVQPSKGGQIRLNRIDPDAGTDAESLDGVLVVFFARSRAQGRQVVVGWYRDATVFARGDRKGAPQRDRFSYNVRSNRNSPDKIVLLPPEDRDLEVPRGKNGTGQSNVTYFLDKRGRPRRDPWICRILDAVDRGAARNLMDGSVLEHLASVEAENAGVAASGQGHLVNSRGRQVIERRAMKVAESYFRSTKWRVSDVHKSKPYDLLCRKKGDEIRVEVKGTQTDGKAIWLTRGEIRASRAAGTHVLAVVSGIRLRHKSGNDWIARGGSLRICLPWRPKDKHLEPLVYQYKTEDVAWTFSAQ